ncbi:TetR/AcrR family transcriptional regulator [Actinosynnema pretiosum subsp. pretiosum]|uniref:Transcriptional regulator, TetR family n=2 Tax=Actinosynnema TaxID=40566 RepID=C6WFK1_ACTMD|nr:TetR/AcrR family transcriptional regulator [Actinosynnema mirum]ACU35936.1 transcriptional regulator, TetR family [Actinosynnema mirum DSM 43827]AXX29358.1 Transcriptional regulator, TetR family [Actinosynnema pretiosum subsp. pretiosum]QUF06391.1 TetR/AcrR family transcriptional regulator [Actinosynnema pretiosum subsp. pretiosum]
MPPARRADALVNRERILEVARDALAESGCASLNSIAKRACVGAGTLYRHFPTREELVLAVYRHEVQRLVDRAPRLLAEVGPEEAFRRWASGLAGYVKVKHGLGEAFSAATRENLVSESYAQVSAAVAALLAAGTSAGVFREGLAADDVLLLMGGMWRVPPGPDGERQAERVLGLVVAALRA